MTRAGRLGAAWLLLVPVLAPGAARAHGTGWRITPERSVAVELYYADGEQMPFADVKVFSPADDAVPVLHGRADGRGRVAFVPDRDGVWTLVAADGDGHGVRASIPVSLDAAASGEAGPSGRAPLGLRLMLIASVLLNVALALLGWLLLSRRRPHLAGHLAGAARARD